MVERKVRTVRPPSRTTLLRVAVYLSCSAVGILLLLLVYCVISGRDFMSVLGNLWIAVLFALSAAVIAALRDQRASRSEGDDRREDG